MFNFFPNWMIVDFFGICFPVSAGLGFGRCWGGGEDKILEGAGFFFFFWGKGFGCWWLFWGKGFGWGRNFFFLPRGQQVFWGDFGRGQKGVLGGVLYVVGDAAEGFF